MLHKHAKKQKVCVGTFCAFGLSSFFAVGWRVGPNPLSVHKTNIPKGKTRSNIYLSVCVYIYMLWQKDQSKQLVVRHS